MLTFQERQTLRELVSDAMREKYLAATWFLGRCKECGTPHYNRSEGCNTCNVRVFERSRRNRPERMEYDRERKRLERQNRQ